MCSSLSYAMNRTYIKKKKKKYDKLKVMLCVNSCWPVFFFTYTR